MTCVFNLPVYAMHVSKLLKTPVTGLGFRVLVALSPLAVMTPGDKERAANFDKVLEAMGL